MKSKNLIKLMTMGLGMAVLLGGLALRTDADTEFITTKRKASGSGSNAVASNMGRKTVDAQGAVGSGSAFWKCGLNGSGSGGNQNCDPNFTADTLGNAWAIYDEVSDKLYVAKHTDHQTDGGGISVYDKWGAWIGDIQLTSGTFHAPVGITIARISGQPARGYVINSYCPTGAGNCTDTLTHFPIACTGNGAGQCGATATYPSGTIDLNNESGSPKKCTGGFAVVAGAPGYGTYYNGTSGTSMSTLVVGCSHYVKQVAIAGNPGSQGYGVVKTISSNYSHFIKDVALTGGTSTNPREIVVAVAGLLNNGQSAAGSIDFYNLPTTGYGSKQESLVLDDGSAECGNANNQAQPCSDAAYVHCNKPGDGGGAGNQCVVSTPTRDNSSPTGTVFVVDKVNASGTWTRKMTGYAWTYGDSDNPGDGCRGARGNLIRINPGATDSTVTVACQGVITDGANSTPVIPYSDGTRDDQPGYGRGGAIGSYTVGALDQYNNVTVTFIGAESYSGAQNVADRR